jgi:tRNA_anti-like
MLSVSVILLISILFLLRRKKFFWAIFLLAIAGGAWYGYKQYTRTNRDIATVKADISLSAAALVKEYEKNDSSANKKYLGKIIETDGIIKEVKKDEAGYYTVVLGETGSLSSVRCSMDTVHQQDAAPLVVGSSTILRGVCTGFNKDDMGLGSDVILNRCVIVSNNKK